MGREVLDGVVRDGRREGGKEGGREGAYLDPSFLVAKLNDVEMIGDLGRQVLNGVVGEVRDETDGNLGLPVQALV